MNDAGRALNTRAVILGVAVWLALLGLGAKWVTNPILKPPAPNLATLTPEDTAKAFPLRLVSLPSTRSTVSSHARQPDKVSEAGETVPARRFVYEDWAFRESRKRVMVFFLAWAASGFGIHGLMARLFRHRPAQP